MKVLVLSPHLDDAVLSVGALIAARVAGGDDVVVATVFSCADADARVAEDVTATAILGARPAHLGLLDAPLRGIARSWSALCATEPAGDVVEDCAAVICSVVASEAPAEVWAPLSCGGHVDHRAVIQAVLQDEPAWSLVLYEDRPYARAAGAVAEAWARLGGRARPGDDGDDLKDGDAHVHFLTRVGAPAFAAAPTPSAVVRERRAWRRQRAPVEEGQRAQRQRAIEAYETERADLVGPRDLGGWPWDDSHECVWRCS